MKGAYQLAVNTSQSQAQILILQSDQLIAQKRWQKKQSHSEVITQSFIELVEEQNLTLNQLDRIYCVNGPGSFTGIRVGVNFCKSLAYSFSCPMVPINSLDLLALSCDQPGDRLMTCLDAQKNSLFLSEYRFNNKNWSKTFSNKVIKLSALSNFIDSPTLVCGDGIDKYKSFLPEKVLQYIKTKEKWMTADLSQYFSAHQFNFDEKTLSWLEFQPLYIKASAPEELRKPTAT